MTNKLEQEKKQLLEIVRDLVERDKQLREKYSMGDKFRFVKDKLQALQEQLEKHVIVSDEQKAQQKEKRIGEDEMLIYVYLYNTQGLVLQTWANMITPKLFYEYSINRPIYAEKKFVEDLIRNKQNKVQHAYLSVIVKKDAVLNSGAQQADIYNNPVLKVREGALHFDKLLLFTHNDLNYEFSSGTFIKK